MVLNSMLPRGRLPILLLIGLAAMSVSATAQAPTAHPSIDSIFTHWIAPDAPGCAVGVYEGDRIIYAKGYGLANVEHRVPITSATVFRMGGLSKQFTALAIVLLAQDGKLALDEPARKYVPELPDFGGTPITIRQLLNQTSGLRDFYAIKRFTGGIDRDLVSTGRNLDYLRHQQSLNFPAGTRFSYTNINYTLLGEIVSRVSGQPLPAFARTRIFAPLGMTHSAYLGPYAIAAHHATAYQAAGAGAWQIGEPNEADYGANGVNSSVEDLVRWNANLISHQVGGDSGWELMTQRGRLNSGDFISYGLGLQHLAFRGQQSIGHQTRFWGYQSSMLHFPAFDGGVAVLCNRATPEGPTALARAVAVAAWPAHFTAESAPPLPSVRIPLAPFAGVYFDSTTRMLHQLSVTGDAVSGGRLGRLRLVGPDTYASGSGFTVQPLPAEAGGRRLVVTNTQSPYGITHTLTHIGTLWKPVRAELMPYAGRYYSRELDATITISIAGDGTDGWYLLVTPRYGGLPFGLGTVQKDTFAMPEIGGNMRFERDSAGQITQFEVNASEGTIGVLFRPIR